MVHEDVLHSVSAQHEQRLVERDLEISRQQELHQEHIRQQAKARHEAHRAAEAKASHELVGPPVPTHHSNLPHDLHEAIEVSVALTYFVKRSSRVTSTVLITFAVVCYVDDHCN